MTIPIAAMKRNRHPWRVAGAEGWLGLAASPTFALMAWMAAANAPGIAICSAASSWLPMNGMAWMYLLMSFFHVPPWLKLAFDRPRQLSCNPH